jgi:hypothetical protein
MINALEGRPLLFRSYRLLAMGTVSSPFESGMVVFGFALVA